MKREQVIDWLNKQESALDSDVRRGLDVYEAMKINVKLHKQAQKMLESENASETDI